MSFGGGEELFQDNQVLSPNNSGGGLVAAAAPDGSEEYEVTPSPDNNLPLIMTDGAMMEGEMNPNSDGMSPTTGPGARGTSGGTATTTFTGGDLTAADPNTATDTTDIDTDGMDTEQLNRQQAIQRLHLLCESASSDASWEEIRRWFKKHDKETARVAASTTGGYGTAPLHLACRNCPPADIVQTLLDSNPDGAKWSDSFGRLALHYAAANGANEESLTILLKGFEGSETVTDQKGRTALHFSLGNSDHPPGPEVVFLLADTGAAAQADENGMLPLHYACAYGATEEVLDVLISVERDSVTTPDRNGRTPLHFALANADRPASPAVVGLLIRVNSSVVDAGAHSQYLPLNPLATLAKRLKPSESQQRENAFKCLELYINAEPEPTAEFMTALQSIPEWMKDKVVLMPVLQNLLNKKISDRFPTMIILLDFYFLVAILITYSMFTLQSMEKRFDTEGDTEGDRTIAFEKLLPMYIGALHFFLREVMQILSMRSLGLFQTWLYDSTNWLDVSFIITVLFWSVVMNLGAIPDDAFRTGTALSLLILWISFLSFLRNMVLEFAVFVAGVLNVIRRLVAFLTALVIILMAFAQMFFTLFQQTTYCKNKEYGDDYTSAFCDNLWASFVKVYTMLLGEVNENDFPFQFATVLFATFMFLVVILLATVLIAMVTDSYGVIKNKRAAIVFWSNRLDFVAEMDAISNGPWMEKLSRIGCCGKKKEGAGGRNIDGLEASDGFEEMWRRLVELFEDQVETDGIFSSEFWVYLMLRLFVLVVVVPAWFVLGVFSAGWLWPPQVRKIFLVQKVSKKDLMDNEDSERRKEQIRALRNELKNVREEIFKENKIDREDVTTMKKQLSEVKGDIKEEMQEIQQIMNMLFDAQTA